MHVGGPPTAVTILPQRLGATPPLGPGDRIAPTRFRDPARADARLRPGAAAIDHGSPESSAPTSTDTGGRADVGVVKTG